MDRYMITCEVYKGTGDYKPNPSWCIDYEEDDLHGRSLITLTICKSALGKGETAQKTKEKVYRLQELIGAPSEVTHFTHGGVATSVSLTWWYGRHNKFEGYSGNEIGAISHATRLTEGANDCLDRLIKLYEKHPGHEELEGMCAEGMKRTTIKMD